ncbi:hypothetical protein CP980_03390 [Streptomyces vinaceus]|uniref:Uncharacterized protein n=1 Tax=Streptomyces vinaceus TaxID=1960 RepID=A0A5J6J080_STRVI|nr:hypothetical protein [Streptomyces vinaceus]QEV44240.1 hypothetical protein CP980_03390 [Streptomyces vinaceus]GHE28155.1 hypothetical protein GCM10017778_07880 [Streptomyces vinaceus]
MNDPITLAATQDDGHRELPDPDPTGTTTPATLTSTEPIRTLLETAGTCRPLEEVAELVTLLEETGQSPGHGHQTLRAAAVGRPVQDVALLVGILGTDEERTAPSDPEPAPGSPDPEPPGRVFRSPRPVPTGEPGLPATAVPAAPEIPSGAAVPAVPSVHPAGPPRTDRAARPGAERDGAPAWHARRPSARPARRPEPPDEEPFDDPYEDERYPSPEEYRRTYGRGPNGGRGAAPAPSGPLRHLLRWPVAAALLLCGALHLPSDVTALSSQPPTAIAALLTTVLCLGLGTLIAVRDTAGAWRAGAVGAVAVVALHVAGGLAEFDPLEGAVSATQAWAGVTAVLCAAAAALLAGLALVNRPPRARAGAGG